MSYLQKFQHYYNKYKNKKAARIDGTKLHTKHKRCNLNCRILHICIQVQLDWINLNFQLLPIDSTGGKCLFLLPYISKSYLTHSKKLRLWSFGLIHKVNDFYLMYMYKKSISLIVLIEPNQIIIEIRYIRSYTHCRSTIGLNISTTLKQFRVIWNFLKCV